MKIEDAVAAMGGKTVYRSGMALNELALFGAEASVSKLAAVADAVKAKSPDARIVVLANTYRTRDFNDSRNKLNNAGISEYNNLLLDYCNEHGFDFVDEMCIRDSMFRQSPIQAANSIIAYKSGSVKRFFRFFQSKSRYSV